jgi:hypothetical protein
MVVSSYSNVATILKIIQEVTVTLWQQFRAVLNALWQIFPRKWANLANGAFVTCFARWLSITLVLLKTAWAITPKGFEYPPKATDRYLYLMDNRLRHLQDLPQCKVSDVILFYLPLFLF